jgi:arylsulfatase A-like enzyme
LVKGEGPLVKRIHIWFLAILATTLFGGTCRLLDAQEQPSKKPNVIVILLDQLQADRLHRYGNPHETSPNIDRLAEQGVRFSHYYSAAPWTAPSDASLMTSLYPSRHGVSVFWGGGDSKQVLNNQIPTLAQVFQSHGYQTAAFVNNSVGGKPVTGRGFNEYYENAALAENVVERLPTPNGALRAPATAEKAISWLNTNQSKPFFLWVLLLEPHSPYNPPPADDIFKSDAYPNLSDDGYDIRSAPLLRLAMLGDSKAIERLYQLYDGKLHYVDRYVGQILDQVKKLGLDKNTIVVLTSDHGELMFSHPKDYLTADHVSLYDPTVHVPLIISGPDLPHGKVIDGAGVNIDTSQTILNLAGLPQLPNADGKSLVPLIQGTKTSIHDYIFGEEDIVVQTRSVRDSQYKLIYDLRDRTKQLFDLQSDPTEQADISGQNPAVTQSLLDQLEKQFHVSQSPSAEQIAQWKLYSHRATRAAGPSKSLVIDDQTVLGMFQLTGSGWHSDVSSTSANYDGGEVGITDQLPKPNSVAGCFWTESGDGSRTAIWRQQNPHVGTYKVYVYYGHPQIGKLASNAVFSIVTDDGLKTVNVNFNQGQGAWQLLGSFNSPRSVSVSNNADGAIIADAVKYEQLE